MKDFIMFILCVFGIVLSIFTAIFYSIQSGVGIALIFGASLLAIDAIIEYKKVNN